MATPRKTKATTEKATPRRPDPRPPGPANPDEPVRLLYTSDGRIIPPASFGGAGLDPAEDGTVVLGLHDPALTPAPRQETQDAVIETPAIDIDDDDGTD